MALEYEGKTIDLTETGFLSSIDDWNEGIAEVIAADEGVSLTQQHWDVINYLRDEFINNSGNQPNNRNMLKDMGAKWGKKVRRELWVGANAYCVTGVPSSMHEWKELYPSTVATCTLLDHAQVGMQQSCMVVVW